MSDLTIPSDAFKSTRFNTEKFQAALEAAVPGAVVCILFDDAGALTEAQVHLPAGGDADAARRALVAVDVRADETDEKQAEARKLAEKPATGAEILKRLVSIEARLAALERK